MKRILILCTGNSCRSQMAEAFIQQLKPTWNVVSAGTNPSNEVHPLAVKVMAEKNISLQHKFPKIVDTYTNQSFDYVITVCDHAKDTCPYFNGEVKKRLHIGFDDPAEVVGNKKYVLQEFRRIRDEIEIAFTKLFKDIE